MNTGSDTAANAEAATPTVPVPAPTVSLNDQGVPVIRVNKTTFSILISLGMVYPDWGYEAISWHAFVSAMFSIGCSVTSWRGSACKIVPAAGMQAIFHSGSATIHRPHRSEDGPLPVGNVMSIGKQIVRGLNIFQGVVFEQQ